MLPLVILRACFILITSGLGIVLIHSEFMAPSEFGPFLTLAGILALAIVVIIIDLVCRKKSLHIISAVYFGLIVGFFLSYMVNIGLTPFYSVIAPKSFERLQNISHLILTVFMCYISISLLLQTQNDFRFIIPYVEFSKELKGLRPYVLDATVVIDGRILDIAQTHIIESPLIIPQFVISDLKRMAESQDKIDRLRGQRGLDILNQLRACPDIELRLDNNDLPDFRDQTEEMKLVLLAKKHGAKLATNDFNLNKIARLNDVSVLSINELANALKPVFVAGEQIDIQIIKAGEEASQGVGYLPDGAMVVVDGGKPHIGKRVQITVTSVLQTSAGRMIFGKYINSENKS
ncbi:MAG: TRAM domain-containing protein [Planctomycetia bacterium]|nr:TRAM domain-containing protein [Planctomycetia bacterium]